MAAPTKAYTFSDTPADTNVIDADEVNENFDRLYDYLADGVEVFAGGGKLAAADLDDAAKLGLSEAGIVRRGKSIVAASENFTQTSFGYAPTPDRVQNIVLPTDGLIFVVFDAAWQSSASGAGSAGIFVGSTIAKGVSGGSYPVTGGATSVGTGVNHLTSAPSTSGLVSASGGYTPLGSDPQVIAENTSGSAAVIMAAAGTYDVGIKYKSTSGSVTVSDRKLWVWTVGF